MKPALLLAASLVLLTWAPFSAVAQMPVAAPPKSAVNADGSITFRLNYPSAKQVTVATDALLQPLALTLGSDGVWAGTTTPLPPEHYGYTFVVDGVHMLDPLNPDVHPNFVDLYSDLLVPATPPAPWELTNIPHGEVSRHIFTTHIGLHYPDDQTAYVVYTPPGYDAKRKGGYPVLYLLHGYSDTEDGWTLSGKANLMLDRMLADGKIVPMIVVMPRGYGDFDVVNRSRGAAASGAMGPGNLDLFDETLLKEVLPAVEREYNVAKGRESRAVAGLSMGGMESVSLGLNRAFVAWAREKGLPVAAVETPGAHTFVVWRENLLTLAPQLFRK